MKHWVFRTSFTAEKFGQSYSETVTDKQQDKLF